MIKRKREAFVGGRTKDDEYSPPMDFSSTGDHELDCDDDASSSYISGSDYRKRKNTRKARGKRYQKLTQKQRQNISNKLLYSGMDGIKQSRGKKNTFNPIDFIQINSRLAEQMALKNQQRQVQDGVSVFDLIMNWKPTVEKQDGQEEQLKKKQLAKVTKLYRKKNQLVQCEDLDKHVKNTQAILINPPWDNMNIFDEQRGKNNK